MKNIFNKNFIDLDCFINDDELMYSVVKIDNESLSKNTIKRNEIIKNFKSPDLPNKRYSIVYADPPWRFDSYSNKGKEKSPENHYKCLSLEDIKNIPIKNICNDDCILFMWSTYPHLEKAFEVINAWGFKYKTVGFTWVKKNKKTDSWFWGLGFWTRSNAEICLIATKGNIKRQSKKVHQIIDTRIEEHSKKPDITRTKIVELCGDIPRIELFARKKYNGWDAWGNEVIPQTLTL